MASISNKGKNSKKDKEKNAAVIEVNPENAEKNEPEKIKHGDIIIVIFTLVIGPGFPSLLDVLFSTLTDDEMIIIRPVVWLVFLIVFFLLLYIKIIRKILTSAGQKTKRIILISYFLTAAAGIGFFSYYIVYPRVKNKQGHEFINVTIEEVEPAETYYQSQGTTKVNFMPDGTNKPITSYDESIPIIRNNGRYGKIATVSGEYKTIYTDTFNCENKEKYSMIDHIDLSEGVETIEKRAFYKCGNLQSVLLPGSITSIDDKAFEDCDNMTLIVYEYSYAYDYCMKNNLKYELIQ